jgi:hypothetical protein
MKKGIIAVIVLIFAAGLTWYFASPSLAMHGLKEAAINGDREELKERVDFPAVRESLKSQAKAHMVMEMQKEQSDNPFAALGMAMAGAIVDPMIDGIVSPSGIKAMVQQGRMVADQKDTDLQPDAKPAEWNIDRRSFDKFIATPEVQNGDRAPSLVFERDGLGWKLVDVEIPEGGLSAADKAQ